MRAQLGIEASEGAEGVREERRPTSRMAAGAPALLQLHQEQRRPS